MSGARTRRQAAIIAAADSKSQAASNREVVENGDGGVHPEPKDVADDYQGENIYLFFPNLIGARERLNSSYSSTHKYGSC
jgi:hypothetical protein